MNYYEHGVTWVRTKRLSFLVSFTSVLLAMFVCCSPQPGIATCNDSFEAETDSATGTGVSYSVQSSVLLSDDFNGGFIEPAKWNLNNLFSGFTDANVHVAESGGQLQIGPLMQGASGSHYNGIVSVNSYDFTGACSYVELVQCGAANTSADAMLTIGADVDNCYRIYVEAGTLAIQKKVGGTKTTLATAAYDSVNDRFLGIRHDAGTGDVVFETAADSGSGVPGAWTSRYSERWNAVAVPLGAVRFELKAGTWRAEAGAPGLVIFDNFEAARWSSSPPAPAPTVSSIAPNSGPAAGGTPVTISGTNFASGATVAIGGAAATNVVVNSSSIVTATTPAHAAGPADVVVVNADRQSATLSTGFSFTSTVGQTPHFGHVFVVVAENHSYTSVIGNAVMPYLNDLASRYGLATNFYANTHPSIGNYFMLTTGQVLTNDDAFSGTVSADNLVRQMIAAGKTWKAYAESLPSVGWTGGDQYPYVKHHNPFAYLADVVNTPAQASNLVPFSRFAGDLANDQLPDFSYIVPNQLNNGHDCPSGSTCTDADKLAATDSWLNTNIAPLLSSALFQQDGLLVVLWDESVDTDTVNGGGHIAALVISPRAKPGFRSTAFYQHQSALRTIAEAIGLTAFPGASATAPAMAEFFDTSASPSPTISSVTPISGPVTGGTPVTLGGSGFANGATVIIGGAPATSVTVMSNTTITAVTPAHSAGPVNAAVTNPNGLNGTLANGFTYAASTETVLLADDFTTTSIDLTKWDVNNLFSGFTDASIPLVDTGQQFEVGPLRQGSSGSHYNGLVSRQRYDVTNAYVYVAVTQAPAVNTAADAMLTIGQDANNYYRFYEEAGVLYVQKKLGGGAKQTLWSAPYDAAAHRYWRIRHDAPTGMAVFETAPANGGAPGPWVERYREAWNVASLPLTNVLLEIKGGTWQSEANAPGKSIFDDFRAAKP